MTIERLSSGSWLVRFSMNQFIQWPCGRDPTMDDAFGWVTDQQIDQAAKAAKSIVLFEGKVNATPAPEDEG